MTRRRLLLALGAALTVIVVVSAVRKWVPRRPRIDEERCARIKPGMSLREVEAIFGGPPGDYTMQEVIPYTVRLVGFRSEAERCRQVCWAGEYGSVHVAIDEQGLVVDAYFSHGFPLPRRPWYECLRDRLFR